MRRGRMATYSQMSSKADDRWSILKLALGAMFLGAVSVSGVVGGILWVKGHMQATRAAERAPACTAAAQRLLTADTVVALEREKYLLAERGATCGGRLGTFGPPPDQGDDCELDHADAGGVQDQP
jgi:hypothetical protein